MSEESKERQDKKLTGEMIEKDIKQEKFDKFLPTFDAHLYTINEDQKNVEESIRELAEKMKTYDIIPTQYISGVIKRRIKVLNEQIKEKNKKLTSMDKKEEELHIPDSVIDRALSKEYKDKAKSHATAGRKKKLLQTATGQQVTESENNNTEQSTSHSITDTQSNDDNNNTEQSTGHFNSDQIPNHTNNNTQQSTSRYSPSARNDDNIDTEQSDPYPDPEPDPEDLKDMSDNTSNDRPVSNPKPTTTMYTEEFEGMKKRISELSDQNIKLSETVKDRDAKILNARETAKLEVQAKQSELNNVIQVRDELLQSAKNNLKQSKQIILSRYVLMMLLKIAIKDQLDRNPNTEKFKLAVTGVNPETGAEKFILLPFRELP